MIPKIFTVDEANDQLPKITKIFDRVFEINRRIKAISSESEIVYYWEEDKNILQKKQLEILYYQVHREINRLMSIGCIVKDIEKGLVDFYYDNEGELIYLCWRYGEDKISHWHRLTNGFVTRKSINDLIAKEAKIEKRRFKIF